MPHSAFQGQTPDEMYFGKGADVPDDLARQRASLGRALSASARQAKGAPTFYGEAGRQTWRGHWLRIGLRRILAPARPSCRARVR